LLDYIRSCFKLICENGIVNFDDNFLRWYFVFFFSFGNMVLKYFFSWASYSILCVNIFYVLKWSIFGYVLKMNVKIIKTKQIKIILWVLGMIHAKDVYSWSFIGICSLNFLYLGKNQFD
jgi:hypothetical protein